MKTRDGV